MSDSDEENFCFFGKPLEPYDEDTFPKKKPITVEEQIATDAQGRRRFHGAFTGGFSAGFFNTVGSLEGWTPSEFKSTREDKAQRFSQKPEDFMDDEDLGEHGIAPQTVRATSDYSTSKKRKRHVFADGPIPGEPVLHSLLTVGNETVGYLLLKNIGIQDKLMQQEEFNNSIQSQSNKVYGCHMPKSYEIPKNIENKQYNLPDIYKEHLKNPKSDTFGLGYEGLNKSHINLFQPTNLVLTDKNNKKVSIAGQAFGVGAFEDDDEDIYSKEDMNRYDFELTSEKVKKKQSTSEKLILDLFLKSKAPILKNIQYPPPTIPHSFTGKHKIKKSRFEPVNEPPKEELNRKDINPIIRAKYLEEGVCSESNKTFTPSKPLRKEHIDTNSKKKMDYNIEDDNLKSKTKGFDIQSVLGFDRFVSASQSEDVANILEPVKSSETEHGTKDMREAARMKMFGPLTRISMDWQPNALLCKRFNVPEPCYDGSNSQNNRKRTKNLIFEYQKHTEPEELFKSGLTTPASTSNIEESNTNIECISENTKLLNTVNEENPVFSQQDSNQSSEAQMEKSPINQPENNTKEITDKVDVEKNMDLFKAVFLSSSESEDETPTEKATDQLRNEEIKSNVLSEQLIPKIKPIKEGILSNVDFIKFRKPAQKSDAPKESCEEKDNIFGPKLPIQRQPAEPRYNATKSSQKEKSSSSDEDEWIEKDKKVKKKKKHKKKNKKEKKSKHDKKKRKGYSDSD